MAGIIAARSLAPTSGVEGLAPRARLLPVKVVADESSSQEGPDTNASTLAEGIRWAADQGAKVVNVSLSTGRDDPRLRAAVAHARSRGRSSSRRPATPPPRHRSARPATRPPTPASSAWRRPTTTTPSPRARCPGRTSTSRPRGCRC
ncbi:S8 family serine peptidase [Phycicoccus sp. HDW14]|nr:S8 family serine peptidase [Phycicoccus sp. HDW14]